MPLPEILDALARAYTEQNRLVEAAKAAERLAEHPSWSLRAGLMLGELRIHPERPRRGRRRRWKAPCKTRAKLRTATSAPSLFRKLLARSLLRLGRPVPARDQLRAVLEPAPIPRPPGC